MGFIKFWIRGVYQGLQTMDDETAKKIRFKAGADCTKNGRDLFQDEAGRVVEDRG